MVLIGLHVDTLLKAQKFDLNDPLGDEFKDFEVQCNDQVNFKVHKFVLIHRCPVLRSTIANRQNPQFELFDEYPSVIMMYAMRVIYGETIYVHSDHVSDVLALLKKWHVNYFVKFNAPEQNTSSDLASLQSAEVVDELMDDGNGGSEVAPLISPQDTENSASSVRVP